MRSFEKVRNSVRLESSRSDGSGGEGSAGGLFTPVDIASLAFFRVAFGLIMLWEVWRYFNYGWISNYYIEPVFHFSYFGFGWVQPWPGIGMYLHFAALGVLAICIALGMFYRVATILFFFGFSYVFLLDQTQYLNHFYYVSLVSLLMIFVPANRAFSLDARRRPEIRTETVPFWAPAILAFQMGIVYFFGGIAKLNADWLRGEPMTMWLSAGADHPFLGSLFGQQYSGYLFSYGGLLLDLLVVPFLLWKRTRLAAFLVITGFHLTNAWMFQIGIFPWFAIAATTMFFSPSWPRRFAHFLHGLWDPAAQRRRARQQSCEARRERDVRRESGEEERESRGEQREAAPGNVLGITPGGIPGAGLLRSLGRRRFLIFTLLSLFVAFQVLFPLRHFAYPGNVSWTEEGHRFAWHMKLRSAEGLATFQITDVQSNQSTELAPEDYIGEFLTERQAQKMSYQPDMILQFAHGLEDAAVASGYEDAEVHTDTIVSMNGREPQQLIDPEVDLTQETRSLTPADYIVPLEEPLRRPS